MYGLHNIMTLTPICVTNPYPRGSMYGIFTYIYHKNQPNVGNYILWVLRSGLFGNNILDEKQRTHMLKIHLESDLFPVEHDTHAENFTKMS